VAAADACDDATSKTAGRWGVEAPVGGDGSAGRGIREDVATLAGGGWRWRGKAVKAETVAGGIIFQ